MTAAMILAAGHGTRLRPLTDELPKPLVPVGDRSVLALVAEALARGGILRAATNAHHLADAFTSGLLGALPLELRLLTEPELLGTAGGVRNAAEALGEGDIVLWNGDILAEVDVRALMRSHEAQRMGATLVVAPREAGQGTVGLGADGRVVRLRGERFGEEAEGGDFLGVHVIGEALRARLPDRGCLVGDVYLPALRRGERLATARHDGGWRDVGSLVAYLEANLTWLADRGLRAWVAESARVDDGVLIERSVIGEGAIVRGEGAIEECVVWPGAEVVAPLRRAVVLGSGRVAAVGSR